MGGFDGRNVTCADCKGECNGTLMVDRHTRLKPLYLCLTCEFVRDKWKRESPKTQLKLSECKV